MSRAIEPEQLNGAKGASRKNISQCILICPKCIFTEKNYSLPNVRAELILVITMSGLTIRCWMEGTWMLTRISFRAFSAHASPGIRGLCGDVLCDEWRLSVYITLKLKLAILVI